MVKVDKTNFQKEVLDFSGVVMVDFYADWCQPCKTLSPVLEEIAEEKKDDPQVKVAKLDIENNQDLAAEYEVQGIPNVVFFKNGKVVHRQVGVAPKEMYEKALEDSASGELERQKQGVKVFSTPTCPYCTQLKNYLKEKNIDFEDIDVSQDQEWAMKMVSKSGQMGVPQAWIEGEVVVGFDKQKVDKLLDNR